MVHLIPQLSHLLLGCFALISRALEVALVTWLLSSLKAEEILWFLVLSVLSVFILKKTGTFKGFIEDAEFLRGHGQVGDGGGQYKRLCEHLNFVIDFIILNFLQKLPLKYD